MMSLMKMCHLLGLLPDNTHVYIHLLQGYVPEEPPQYVTEEALQGIASEEQIRSLFCSEAGMTGKSSTAAVRDWLEGRDSCIQPPVPESQQGSEEPVFAPPGESTTLDSEEDLADDIHLAYDVESIDSDIEYDENFNALREQRNGHAAEERGRQTSVGLFLQVHL